MGNLAKELQNDAVNNNYAGRGGEYMHKFNNGINDKIYDTDDWIALSIAMHKAFPVSHIEGGLSMQEDYLKAEKICAEKALEAAKLDLITAGNKQIEKNGPGSSTAIMSGLGGLGIQAGRDYPDNALMQAKAINYFAEHAEEISSRILMRHSDLEKYSYDMTAIKTDDPTRVAKIEMEHAVGR